MYTLSDTFVVSFNSSSGRLELYKIHMVGYVYKMYVVGYVCRVFSSTELQAHKVSL